MALSRAEKERVSDSRLKLQSVANALSGVDPENVPDFEQIQDCLENAEKNLKTALRAAESDSPADKRQN